MNTYIFEKQIKLDEVANKIESINLKENYDYINLVNALHVVGKISISGTYLSDNHSLPFEDTLDIDVIIPNENIANMVNLRFSIQSYDTHLVDNNINLKINCLLDGYDYTKEEVELKKTFQEVIETLDKDNPNSLLDQFRDNLSEEDEKRLEDLINGKVEIIDTTVEENKDLESKEIIDVPVESQNEDDNKDEIKLEPVEEVTSEVIENKINEIKDKQVPPTRNNLFSEERFVVFSRFYRVRNEDTYESIASANKVDILHLKSLNKNKELTEGMLIQIPR